MVSPKLLTETTLERMETTPSQSRQENALIIQGTTICSSILSTSCTNQYNIIASQIASEEFLLMHSLGQMDRYDFILDEIRAICNKILKLKFQKYKILNSKLNHKSLKTIHVSQFSGKLKDFPSKSYNTNTAYSNKSAKQHHSRLINTTITPNQINSHQQSKKRKVTL
jgi:hypothetical protein